MFEKIQPKLIRATKAVVAAATIPALVGLWNYAVNQGTRLETADTLYLKKRDGLLAHGQIDLSYSRRDIILEITDPFGQGSRKYTDRDRDGQVDEVYIERSALQVSGRDGSFDRREDEDNHSQLFKQEQIRYQQHLREFAEQFPQDFRRMGLEKILIP